MPPDRRIRPPLEALQRASEVLVQARNPAILAGSGDVSNRIHRLYGDRLMHSCVVGATHHDAKPRDNDLPGAPPTEGPLRCRATGGLGLRGPGAP